LVIKTDSLHHLRRRAFGILLDSGETASWAVALTLALHTLVIWIAVFTLLPPCAKAQMTGAM
jgi:hypothetical protein